MGQTRTRKTLKSVTIAAALLLSVLATYFYLGRNGSTPAFRTAAGMIVRGSVAEMRRVHLGGADQSIVIRGRNANAPILIWLHGGPGLDATGMWRHFNAALEDHFLVVYWTQRGTGRSYAAKISPASMRISQFVSDLDELVTYLTLRFHQRKVVLVGHSWGSTIGVAYTQAHPEKVAAYVGTGQVVNGAEGERRTYRYTVEEARRRNNHVAIKELAAIGAPPYPLAALLTQRRWLNEFGGAWHRRTSLPYLLWTSFQASEVTWLDGVYFQRGQDFSLAALYRETERVDWLRSATRFQMPVFFLMGRYDRNTDVDLALTYFRRLKAPTKRFVLFESSAHSPSFEQPTAFNRVLIHDVLPAAVANAKR